MKFNFLLAFFILVLLPSTYSASVQILDSKFSPVGSNETSTYIEETNTVREQKKIRTSDHVCSICTVDSECLTKHCIKGFCVRHRSQVRKCRRTPNRERRERREGQRQSFGEDMKRIPECKCKCNFRSVKRRRKKSNLIKDRTSSCSRCKIKSDCVNSGERCINDRCALSVTDRSECPEVLTGERMLEKSSTYKPVLSPECSKCEMNVDCGGANCIGGYCVSTGSLDDCMKLDEHDSEIRTTTSSSTTDKEYENMIHETSSKLEKNDGEDENTEERGISEEFEDYNTDKNFEKYSKFVNIKVNSNEDKHLNNGNLDELENSIHDDEYDDEYEIEDVIETVEPELESSSTYVSRKDEFLDEEEEHTGHEPL